MFETLHTGFYEIFGETKLQHLVNTWPTFVNFKAFSRKSKLNPDYVMRYELSIKLSQENLYEMALISMIRSSTVHDLATRTSSGSLSNHMFTSRRPYISHEPYIIATLVTLKRLLLKISMQDWFEVSASTHSYISRSSRTSRYVILWKPLKALHHICHGI